MEKLLCFYAPNMKRPYSWNFIKLTRHCNCFRRSLPRNITKFYILILGKRIDKKFLIILSKLSANFQTSDVEKYRFHSWHLHSKIVWVFSYTLSRFSDNKLLPYFTDRIVSQTINIIIKSFISISLPKMNHYNSNTN